MAICECCGQTIREPTSEKFNEFWTIYPSKVGKKKAYQAWKRDKLDAIADQIIECVRTRIEKDPRWQAGYVQNPLTFINGEHWEDEIVTNPKVMQWPTKNEDWIALGKEHGIMAGMGEGWPQFKDRVKRAIGE